MRLYLFAYFAVVTLQMKIPAHRTKNDHEVHILQKINFSLGHCRRSEQVYNENYCLKIVMIHYPLKKYLLEK